MSGLPESSGPYTRAEPPRTGEAQSDGDRDFDARALEAEVSRISAAREGVYGVLVFEPGTGQTVAVNADEEFEAASLAKLYTMLALYRAVDRGELRLEEEISIQPTDVAGYGTGVLHNYPAGYQMTLRECVEYLIRESDNTAWVMLNRLLGEEEIQREVDEIGLQKTDYSGYTTTPDDVLTALRAIADPAFTSEGLSGEMLEYMTGTAYEDRIPEPLPEGARVAHKIGSYGSSHSDAGIVYPQSGGEYYLVILSTEAQEEDARQAMQEISLATYRSIAGYYYAPPPPTPGDQAAGR